MGKGGGGEESGKFFLWPMSLALVANWWKTFPEDP